MPLERLQAALEHVSTHSVTIVSFEDWQELVRFDGDPTRLEITPIQLSGIMSVASRVAAAGSGIYNRSPGIDIVRHDPLDAPNIYNIYHYTVLENFHLHSDYGKAITIANVEDTEELRDVLNENVFVVGPYKIDDYHWVKEIPVHIANAKNKDE